MEIERKYLVKDLPKNYEEYPHRELEQGYLCTDPVVRIRKAADSYTLTYKGQGLMIREEYNLPLTAEAYQHLRTKADGILIHKIRYNIPFQKRYIIELDIFLDELAPLQLAEVEFETEEEANAFVPPPWFGEDVTFSDQYHNSTLSQKAIG
ncbi:MAG: CYTH domain-containing protein [Roseburia sp.]|nr:CYTH domain-containing protein [Roseburia sp.]